MKKKTWLIIIVVGIFFIGGLMIFYKPQLIKTFTSLPSFIYNIFLPATIPDNQVSTQANLVNITAEGNFTHLNISTSVPYNSLVGYWNFDGDKENTLLTTVYDWSKYNNDGTGAGNVIVNNTNCIYGDCARFDGEGDYVLYNPISLTGNFTLSGWYYFKLLDTAEGYTILYDSHVDNTNKILIKDGGSKMYIRINNVNTADFSVSNIPTSTWTQLSFVRNGTNISVYINGNLNTIINNIGTPFLVDSFGDDSSSSNDFNGTIDDVMIFNTSLTSAQILAIYNNQSARFVTQGTQDIVNQTYMNITSGNNRVNVTTYTESLLGSSINLSVGYYDGSWSSTAQQIVTSGAVKTFTISSTSTNLTLNYTMYAGNSTNPFYSPIIKYNITYEVWNEAGGDTTYPDFSDYWDDNGSLIDTGIGKFNVTVTSTNGTVILHINNTNILATNLTSNVYNASWNFTSSGTYLYNWTAYGNGTIHNLNTSANRYYTVNSSTPSNCWTKTGNVLFIPKGCVYQVLKGVAG